MLEYSKQQNVDFSGRAYSIRLSRAVLRLLVLWLISLLAGGIFSDFGVHASEGDSILQLPAPDNTRPKFSKARVVSGVEYGRMEVVRSSGEQAGMITVVTGFPCENSKVACDVLDYGAFSEAASIFRNQIALGNDQAVMRCGLANALFLDGDLLGAARAYTWAAAGYPLHPDVHNGLGNIFTELLQLPQAVKEFKILASEPGYAAVAYNNLGNAYRKVNRLQEALAEYEKALQADSELVAAHYNRAGTLLALERFDEAARSFLDTAHRAPHFVDAYLYQGLAHLRSRDSILAAAALYRAAELGADSPVLHLALGVACQELSLDEEAVTHLRQVVSEDPKDEKVYQLLAVSLVRTGKLDQAAQVLEQGFLYGPQDADAHFFLGLKLFLCEEPAVASRHFVMAAAKGRRTADTFFALGQALYKAGEVESSIKALLLAVQMSPQAPEIHFGLGVALFHGGDTQGAIRELKTAGTLDPKDTDTQLVLMEFMQRSGDYEGCARIGRQLVDQEPEMLETRFDTALCQALFGDLDRAAETMEDALDHDIDGREVLKIWKRLSALIDTQEKKPGPHLLLAIIHERWGNWSEAVRFYEKFILVSPSKSWAQKALGRIHELIPHESDPVRRVVP